MNTEFQDLLTAYATSVGLPVAQDAQMLEFETQGLTVFIRQDPRRSSRLMAQITCDSLDDKLNVSDQAHIALLLHHLNSAARFEHDWVITVDPARVVHLHTQCSVTETSPADLEQLMTQALDRAQALQQLLAGLQQITAAETTGQRAAVPEHLVPGSLRV